MTTIPRVGFRRVGGPPPEHERPRNRGVRCRTGKIRHPSETGALEALVRVRKERFASDDGRLPESRIYLCRDCGGWHLTSTDLHPSDLEPVRERKDGEPWEIYAKRLERRVAEQRTHIVSLHALGAGATNRAMRRRVPALLVALGRMTERWDNERRNREELVRQLDELRSRKSLFARLRLRRTPGAVTPEAASTTERAETSDA